MERTPQARQSGIDDLDVIRKVLNGDSSAYAGLVRRYQAKILGLCHSMLADATQAEDAAQEIFIKIYQSLSSFKADSSFSTWTYRISANHCKDLLRKRKRQKTQSLDALIEEAGDSPLKNLEPSYDPAASLKTRDLIERLLSRLSEEERLIVTLREVQGLSYQEISQTLGCSLDAVKARLKRARAVLQEKTRHFLAGGSV